MQRQGAALLRALGGRVYELGHRRSRPNPECPVCRKNMTTRQTPGLPDVEAFLPIRGTDRWTFLKWEVKHGGNTLSPEQRTFRDLCGWASVWHVSGDLDALMAALVLAGFLKAENVPHYRVGGSR